MMKIPLVVWCFTMALLLKLNYSSADSNVTDSELLNVILENTTYFDKELNSDRNISNESLFSNNGDNISSSTNEECRTGNCERKLNSSLSASSSSSKILWNFVSIPKSTTEYSIGETREEEGYSTSPGIPQSTNQHENHSSGHSSSFHSNDNELDSKIDFDIDYVLHSDGDTTNYSTSSESHSNVTVTDSMPMSTVIIPFGINSTNSSESGEVYMDLMNFNTNLENLSISSTTLAPQNTLIPTDDELDFTTYLSNPFDSNESELSAEEISSHASENSTIEISTSRGNTVLYSDHYGNNNSNVDVTGVEVTTESKVHEGNFSTNAAELKTSNHNFESVTTEMSFDEEIVTTDSYYIYDTTLSNNSKISTESKIPLSSNVVIDPIYVLSTHSSASTSLRSREETTTGENLFTAGKEILNTMETALHSDSFITEPQPTIKTELSVNSDIAEYIDATSIENGLYLSSQVPEMIEETSSTTENLLLAEKISGVTMESTEANEFSTMSQEKASTTYSSIPSSVQELPEHYSSDDSGGNFSERSNPISSHDVPLSEIVTDSITLTSIESDGSYGDISSSLTEQHSTILPPYIDADINEVHLRSSTVTPMETTYHSSNLNDLNNYLISVQTDHDTTSLHSKSAETSAFPKTSSSPSVPSSTESSFIAKIDVTSESFNLTRKDIDSTTMENSDMVTTEDTNEHSNFSVFRTQEIQEERTEIVSSTSTTMDVMSSVPISVSVNDGNIETTQISTMEYHFSEIPSGITKEKSETTVNFFEIKADPSVSESQVNIDVTSAATDFDTMHISNNTLTKDTTVSFSNSNDVSAAATEETYREGKHIPFSSTLVKSTTVHSHPVTHDMTISTISNQPEPTATEKNFAYLLYNQIKAEELTVEERLNVVEAFIKLPDKLYSSEELNDKILIIHLWLLHAIADEYKNASLQSLSELENKELDEVEFENLPQILYIEPSPKIDSPNISLAFIVNNKWRNETYAVDLIVTILNLHTEDLKHVLEFEEIYIYHNMAIENKDLFSVIIAKYGIVLLSTCVITVIMILLLICVVIYYRRKNRHSAHCLTDDKLHRNMQEAMGIDLNPAVIILQDEIREKAALNGNKISSLDDDEGWLAPIGDVPVAEDNSAPYVQDTKL